MRSEADKPLLFERFVSIARSKGWLPQAKLPYTEDQRQHDLNRLLSSSRITRFDNIDVWLIVIKAISDKRKKTPYLLERERDDILQSYVLYATDLNTPNVSVSELISTADIADLTKHPLLSKICFNYDGNLGAEERHQKAMEGLMKGKRGSVSINDSEFISLERWVQYEFESLGNFRRPYTYIEVIERFNKSSQTTEYGFQVSDMFGGDRYLFEALKEITSLLKPEELIKAVKPSTPFFPSHGRQPIIVQRYTNHPPIHITVSDYL